VYPTAGIWVESHACYAGLVMREITQRQLRNESGEIMRELDRGESFVVTRNGNPVGELRPIKRRRFVPKAEVLAAFSGVGHIDYKQFRADIDRYVDQDPTPRAWERWEKRQGKKPGG
jgi:antitoxin (DNA-binding transcriptional repressor) of toxin-antitoxin stability system